MENDSKTTPPKGNHEIYTPLQIHSKLEELLHLTNCVYETLAQSRSAETQIESGIYTLGLVASKLDDLVFHYECILEKEQESEKRRARALALFRQLSPENQQKTLAVLRGMTGDAEHE